MACIIRRSSFAKNENLIGPKEVEAYTLLEKVYYFPHSFKIEVYERTVLSSKLFKNPIFLHSFYLILGGNKKTTLSYNGLDGTWNANTKKDIVSLNNPAPWDLENITPVSGVDNQKTAKKIIQMIQSGEDSYWVLDHIKDAGEDKFNCNTALQFTLVKIKNKKKV